MVEKYSSINKFLHERARKEYNKSFWKIVKMHVRFNIKMMKVSFVEAVNSIWFSFLFFVSKVSKRVTCSLIEKLYVSYDRTKDRSMYRPKIYMNRDKYNSGHSKISRIAIKREKDLILDEDEWMRVSEEMQKNDLLSSKIEELKGKVRSDVVYSMEHYLNNEKSTIDLVELDEKINDEESN